MPAGFFPEIPAVSPFDPEDSESPGDPKNDQPAVRADECAARQIDLGMGDEIRTLLHDPASGLAARPPEEVLAAVPEAKAAVDKIRDSALARPANPRQQSIVDQLAAFRTGLAHGQIDNIAERAATQLDDSTVERRIEGLKQDAALSWDNGHLLRTLGRGVVEERRYQGERRDWSKEETEPKVRQDLSDLYAGAVEGAIPKDLDRAGKLYAHGRDVILPGRQAELERKLAEARDDQ
jgi:hypothetical protein